MHDSCVQHSNSEAHRLPFGSIKTRKSLNMNSVLLATFHPWQKRKRHFHSWLMAVLAPMKHPTNLLFFFLFFFLPIVLYELLRGLVFFLLLVLDLLCLQHLRHTIPTMLMAGALKAWLKVSLSKALCRTAVGLKGGMNGMWRRTADAQLPSHTA